MSTPIERRIEEIENLLVEMSSMLHDCQRRLVNVVRTGRILETDPGQYLVRVGWGKNEQDEWVEGLWMPWTTRAASDNKDWNPPSVGEQVLIFSPCGHVGPDSWAMPGGFSGEIRPNAGANGIRKINVGTGTELLLSGNGITMRTGTFTVQADQISLRGQRIDHDQRPLSADPPKPDDGPPVSGDYPTS